MAIKNQCEGCKSFTHEFCRLGHNTFVFDNSNCDDYVAKSTDLVGYKNGLKRGYEETKQDGKIKGWLLFFLITLGLGAFFSAIYPIVVFDFSKYGYSVVLASVDIAVGIAALLLGVYTIVAFEKRKPNAVFLAKSYTLLVFLSNLIFLLFNIYDENGLFTMDQRMRGIFWGGIWFIYLCCSKQVNTLFPKDKRRMYLRDICMLSSIVAIPLLLVFVVFPIEAKKMSNEVAVVIVENRFAITVPSDMHPVNYFGEGFSLQYANVGGDIFITVFEESYEKLKQLSGANENEYSEWDIESYYEIVKDQLKGNTMINKKNTLIDGMPAIISTMQSQINDMEVYYLVAYIKGEYGFYQVTLGTTAENADRLNGEMNDIVMSFKELRPLQNP